MPSISSACRPGWASQTWSTWKAGYWRWFPTATSPRWRSHEDVFCVLIIITFTVLMIISMIWHIWWENSFMVESHYGLVPDGIFSQLSALCPCPPLIVSLLLTPSVPDPATRLLVRGVRGQAGRLPHGAGGPQGWSADPAAAWRTQTPAAVALRPEPGLWRLPQPCHPPAPLPAGPHPPHHRGGALPQVCSHTAAWVMGLAGWTVRMDGVAWLGEWIGWQDWLVGLGDVNVLHSYTEEVVMEYYREDKSSAKLLAVTAPHTITYGQVCCLSRSCLSQPSYRAQWSSELAFSSILISPRMITDHMPDVVLCALRHLTQDLPVPLCPSPHSNSHLNVVWARPASICRLRASRRDESLTRTCPRIQTHSLI